MPKEPLPLEKFNLGLITAIDPQDIPKDACSYSENLDGNVTGRLQGILANSLKSSSVGISAVGINGWLKRDTGEYDLIYTDNTNIKAIKDFYGTPTDGTEISNKVIKTLTTINRTMHIGVGSTINDIPQFVGWGGEFAPFGGIGDTVFTGGTPVLTFKGLYTGNANAIYTIEATDSTHYKWKKDSGSFSSPIEMTSSAEWVEIAEGITVFHGGATFTTGDSYALNVYAKNAISLIKQDATLNTHEHSAFGTATPDTGKFSLYYSNSTTGTIRVYAGHSADSPDSFDKRITAMNIYRSEDSAGKFRFKYSLIYDGIQESLLTTNYIEQSGYDDKDAGQYRLIKSVLIGNGDEWIEDSDAHPNDLYIEYTDAHGASSVSYEQNSGNLENADTTLPNYELSCSINNSNFVTKCYIKEIPDAKMMLFKSNDFCYDSFDVINDKCFLNIIPTALAGFNNKIYAWDSNTTVIVNASNLAIENVIYGTGCLSQVSWTIIDTIIDDKPFRALVFADANDVYMDDGTGARPISSFIKKKVNSSAIDWQGMQHTSMNPILVYDAVKNTLLCISSVNYAGNIASVLAFNIVNRRWDYYPDFCNYSSTSYLCKSAFAGKNGETYSVTGSQVLNNFGNTTNRAWKYYSPELTFDLPKQPKKFYNMYLDKVETSGTITPTYSVNKGSSYGSLTSSTEIKTGSAWEKANSIILALSATAGVNYVNAIELLYRKMVGVR